MPEPRPIGDLLEYMRRKDAARPWYQKLYRKIKWGLYHFFVDDIYYKYFRNWNWNVPMPRGIGSRHGFNEPSELIPASMFALFMRFYEYDYVKFQYKYTDADLEESRNHVPGDGYHHETVESVTKHLVYQRRIEWVANWIKTVYDVSDHLNPFDVEQEEQYYKDLHKAMHIIVKYRGWMWT